MLICFLCQPFLVPSFPRTCLVVKISGSDSGGTVVSLVSGRVCLVLSVYSRL